MNLENPQVCVLSRPGNFFSEEIPLKQGDVLVVEGIYSNGGSSSARILIRHEWAPDRGFWIKGGAHRAYLSMIVQGVEIIDVECSKGRRWVAGEDIPAVATPDPTVYDLWVRYEAEAEVLASPTIDWSDHDRAMCAGQRGFRKMSSGLWVYPEYMGSHQHLPRTLGLRPISLDQYYGPEGGTSSRIEVLGRASYDLGDEAAQHAAWAWVTLAMQK